MKNYVKNLILIITFFSLTACAGTGYKNYDDISSIVEEPINTKVFIIRDMGYQGSINLVHIKLNNLEIADLGEGEMTVADGKIGSNVLSLELGGIAGIGVGAIQKTFEILDGENKYFIIGLKMGLLGSKMKLDETVKSSWVETAKD